MFQTVLSVSLRAAKHFTPNSVKFHVFRCSRTARNRARRLGQILPHLGSYNGRQARVSQNIHKICPALVARRRKNKEGLLRGADVCVCVCVCVRFLPYAYGLTPAQSAIGM